MDSAEGAREAQRRYRQRHPMRKVLSAVRSRAKMLGIAFDLTEQYLYDILPEYCPLMPTIKL